MDFFYEKTDGEVVECGGEPCWGNLTKDESDTTVRCGVLYRNSAKERVEAILKEALEKHPLFKMYADRFTIGEKLKFGYGDYDGILFDYSDLDIAHIKIILQWLRGIITYVNSSVNNEELYARTFPLRKYNLAEVFIHAGWYANVNSFAYSPNSDMWQRMWDTTHNCVPILEYVRWCLGHPYAVERYKLETTSAKSTHCALSEDEYSISKSTFISRKAGKSVHFSNYQSFINTRPDSQELLLSKTIDLLMAIPGKLTHPGVMEVLKQAVEECTKEYAK